MSVHKKAIHHTTIATCNGILCEQLQSLGIALGEQSFRIEFVCEFLPVLRPARTQERDHLTRVTLLHVRTFLAVRLDGVG